jgi:hypothetical protein
MTDEEIGQLLEPPKRPTTVKRWRQQALWILEFGQSRPLDQLGLSPRVRNAIYRGFRNGGVGPSLEDLSKLSKEEFHGMRIGEKSFNELQTKLSAHLNVSTQS